ncbi:hypothetical protein [Flavobacterium sp.]|jgi:hypothetical protein|uniref:hypothetical protein n=1 Tax=Flavobacterium sp. TaxID=239 RepID=UPI0022C5980B|nr:hypothetical protein [Flavobacterium sp.]MCZ8169688.1 hypothetical protein [Flavobacterium sp.]MCZ8297986.1 hypothetical protein [Flavobacterium sp.]
MTAFQCKIVVKKKPSGLNWTRSEQLYNYGALGSIGMSTLFHFLKEKLDVQIPTFFNLLLMILILAWLSSFFLRLNEHKNFNAAYIGDFHIEEHHFHCAGREFPFTSLRNLKTDIRDFYGKKTGNRRIGPHYSNGIDNFIAFDSGGESFTFQLEFLSERVIDDFNWALINCICSERIPYQRSNFNCIPEELLDMPTVRNFIAKLLKEQRIDASDSLVIRGYYIDETTN